MSSGGSGIELLGQNEVGGGRGWGQREARDVLFQGDMFGKGGIDEQLWASRSS